MDRRTMGMKTLEFSILAMVLGISIVATFLYPGQTWIFIVFAGLTIAMVHAALTNNTKSYYVFYLFSFMALGYWAKIVLHLLSASAFIEPTGSFEESPEAWDKALIVIIVAFSALLVSCWLAIYFTKGRTQSKTIPVDGQYLPSFLTISLITSACLLGFNYYFSIIKIGYEPSLKLNSYIYVVFAFMVAWGNVIILSTLACWMVANRSIATSTLFYIVIFEGALAAISMGSRVQMILHVSAPFVLYMLQGKSLVWHLTSRDFIKIALTTALLFVFSLLAVSAERIESFAKAIPVEEQSESHTAGGDVWLRNTPHTDHSQLLLRETKTKEVKFEPTIEQKTKMIAREISKLIVDRWVGIEGVLAVTSHQYLSNNLLEQGLKEDPAKGVKALYQRMSDAKYGQFSNFTFMTIPGPIAVLFYSGSHLVVFFGMAILFITGYFIEFVTSKTIKNAMANATVGVALAYLTVQINFPRAFLFFLIELIAFLIAVALLKKLVAIRE